MGFGVLLGKYWKAYYDYIAGSVGEVCMTETNNLFGKKLGDLLFLHGKSERVDLFQGQIKIQLGFEKQRE